MLYNLARNYRKGGKEIAYAIKDKEDNLLVKSEDIAERWREYLEELLNAGDVQEPRNMPCKTLSQNGDPITRDEFNRALTKMRKDKAAGEDCTSIELYQAAGPQFWGKMLELFNIANNTETIPSDWQKGIICPIWKKGRQNRLWKLQRDYTVVTCVEMYGRIIENGLRTLIESIIGESQHGFRPGKNTIDLIFTIKMLLDKSWEWGKEKFALFIDMENPFSRVNRQALWETISDEYYPIPPKVVRIIKNMYLTNSCKVRNPGSESGWFEIMTGAKQGDVISPFLFILFMDKCLRVIGVERFHEEILAYADDVVVVADSITDLQEILHKWHHEMPHKGMKINISKGKTEFMSINRVSEVYDLYLRRDKLNQMKEYTYLGIKLDSKNTQEMEIDKRIMKYDNKVRLVYPLLKDKNINRNCKLIIYNTILKSIVLYGSECWSLTTRTESKIQAAEMRILRTIKGVTRKDRIRNIAIRAELKVEPLLDTIEKITLFAMVRTCHEKVGQKIP